MLVVVIGFSVGVIIAILHDNGSYMVLGCLWLLVCMYLGRDKENENG